ncbi:DUF2914 domain-containing protein [Rheinheimera texasensis]|uniref:DUF2914 domain-containing protein n=1 Tax=Rheinheimera texasensis TaxID=306205 RepID=UPI0004E16BCC|nr:DUF2914 domain-containing protein [Rheinheimera texasensis]
MSEAASRLTVKVKLHPAALPPETDTPVVQPAPWSKTRITLASLMLVGAGVAGYQFLLRPVEPLKPAVTAEPEQAAQSTVQSTTAAAAVIATSLSNPVEPQHAIATTAVESVVQPAEPEPAVSEPEVVSQSKPAAEPQPSASVQQATATPAENISAAEKMVLPQGFSRIVLTDQMNNLQPGKAVGQQIAFSQIKRLYLFTELKDYAGQILRHRWYFHDTLHTEAVLTIEDSPWRTYSENWLLDDQRGPWRVEIVDQTQKVIFQYSFTYQ